MPLTPAARWYLRGVAASVACTLAIWVWHDRGSPPADVNIVVLAELIAVMIVAQHYPLSVAPPRKFDVSIGFYFAILLLAGGPLAMALAGVGELIGQATLALRRDRQSGKPMRRFNGVLFNTSQTMLAVAAGAVGGTAFGTMPPLVAIAGAAALLYLTNSATVALMIALQQGRDPVGVWLDGRRWSAVQAIGMLGIGALTARSAAHDPLVPLLMVLPAAVTYVASKRAAEAATEVRVRDEFLSVASHELRTPLTALRGYVQFLRANFQPEPMNTMARRQLQAVYSIDQQSLRLSALVDQVLDFSLLAAGKLQLEPQRVDLTALARELVESLQSVAAPYTLRLQAAEPVFAVVDKVRMEEVITNLITNAVRYAGRGDAIDVEVAALPGGGARVAVRDYGVGIPDDQRERVFDRYFQMPRGGRQAGLGLGLFVVRQLVALHGGTVTVESPPGGGVRFVITVPGGLLEQVPQGSDAVVGSQPLRGITG